MALSIPVKLLNEAQGHIISAELTSGESYRGKLVESEDSMNIQLKDVTLTAQDGKVSHMEQIFIRGSQIRFFSVPEILKNAPIFNANETKPQAPIRGPRRR
ncbi:Core Sm protein Sm D3, spliceosomal U1, U2, U4, and U5 snRNPs component [Komagataella phaffii CBS 7435]|uniref:Small nuclear ribonucleoprotein Sm D3 n=3 Tax=Komagataella TaxID=460517 RepID=C4QYZ9_KOMPG|nr:Core Sm protein Sm D3 [Komagataella phaffii GS115]ANZ76915.1 BA75_04181T0 [Komagataella pastoris]AOA60562.1 GQ67_01525T0 [Komagataella phaffii]KAI0464169.1 small nuclear ribonucleoprotein Sm D3 [Komagataella kurtzmanii]CAH2447299.1 Core Sm protein Sm D3, spliceosomal U1, U2, U4, and U5 snRNPs component [Komagataella phaffii CBS 7435]AOA65717.1 GQ68_01541T0 [Komagataella phaffii GS115]